MEELQTKLDLLNILYISLGAVNMIVFWILAYKVSKLLQGKRIQYRQNSEIIRLLRKQNNEPLEDENNDLIWFFGESPYNQ